MIHKTEEDWNCTTDMNWYKYLLNDGRIVWEEEIDNFQLQGEDVKIIME